MTIAEWMAVALGDPADGYYVTRDPLGAAGDFVTAPEISQTFGEMIGLWIVDLWDRAGRPDPVIVAEFGPGRGTLMADALRAAAVVPAFLDAARIVLVETSPALRDLQAATIDRPVEWADDLEHIPAGPLIAIANEFFDALPVHQFVCRDGAWRECFVDLAPDGGFRLVEERSASARFAALGGRRGAVGAEGDIVELSPVAGMIAEAAALRVARDGLALLAIDYGAAPPAWPTLQAVSRHSRADPFADPGSTDITAHVDFAALADRAQTAGARSFGPVGQGEWLRRLGIESRAAVLASHDPGIAAGVGRLIDPAAMGTLFKAFAIARPGLIPAGFLPAEEWTA